MLNFKNKTYKEKLEEEHRIIYEGVRQYRKHVEDVLIEARVEPDYLTFVKRLEEKYKDYYEEIKETN